MGRVVPYEKDGICEVCGKTGAYHIAWDGLICEDCLVIEDKDIPREE